MVASINTRSNKMNLPTFSPSEKEWQQAQDWIEQHEASKHGATKDNPRYSGVEP
jgi:hypothetical protein